MERVRNSSLVECARADNVARLKHRTEAVDSRSAEATQPEMGYGRGALCAAEKPERKHRWSAHKSECRNE
jgi:hypothetical protein